MSDVNVIASASSSPSPWIESANQIGLLKRVDILEHFVVDGHMMVLQLCTACPRTRGLCAGTAGAGFFSTKKDARSIGEEKKEGNNNNNNNKKKLTGKTNMKKK